jgi:hypothetical protein
VRLGCWSFQKLKEPLRHPPAIWCNPPAICALHKNLDLYCALHYIAAASGAATSRQQNCTPVREGTPMIKVEDIQSYGKDHLETVVASATTVQNGLQAIASAYGDYTKKSFEDTKSFVEKLSGVKSLDKAIEVQTEFAKSAYETYVAEVQKIAGLYTDLAKQAYKPFEGLVAKFIPASAH